MLKNTDTPVSPPFNRILFESPDLENLVRSNTVVDLHFHSHHSDGADSPGDIAARAEALGIGVAITDHNAIEGALELNRYPHLLSIPGIEITSRQGAHVLVYFYEIRALEFFFKREIEPCLGRDRMASVSLFMEEIIGRAARYDALVVFPHPYCAMYTGICNPLFPEERQSELLEKVDGVEVINAGNLKKWNLKSALLGFNLGNVMTGGSDGHSLHQMGKAVTCAPTAPDRVAFLDALRQGQNRVVGRELNLIRKMAASGAKVPSSLKNSPNLMGKNLRYSYAVLNNKTRRVKVNMQQHLHNRRLRNNA
ncbi:MAG: PHP domain-containing protein [Desulfosudaceae bacterium]